MKRIVLLALLFISAGAFAQSGVYLTVEDFKSGKLTDECKVVKIPSGPGEDDRLVLLTKNGPKTHMFDKIWGYKDGLSEYRMLYGRPNLIVCKGEVYAFAPYGPIKAKGKKIIYYRHQVGFGEITITRDLNDPNPTTLTEYIDLWKKFDPAIVPGLKEFYAGRASENNGVQPIPEQIISFYNSTKPGYVAPLYTDIEVNIYRE